MRNPYLYEHEIEAVVQGFENCTTSKDEFTHREHLTVAVWYLRHLDPDQALAKMRSGLFRFLDHHGVGRTKYKETLTVSWMTLVEKSLDDIDTDLSILEVTNIILNKLGDSRLLVTPDGESVS